MKKHNQFHKPLAAAALALALTCVSGLAAAVPDVVATPGAMQPGGNAADTTRNFGQWWDNNGIVSEVLDTTVQSDPTIAGSLYVTVDCPGGTATPLQSANLAFGNFFSSLWGDNGWLGAGHTFDASKYQSLNMDLYIATTVSSNTAIPFCLWGYNYENIALTNYPITTPGWQHVVIPIPATINLADCTGYGAYFWYNTTASTPPAHVEYWFDNVRLVARQAPPPPPTLSLAPESRHGLMFDSAPGEGGQRGGIDTVLDVHWAGIATPSTPVTYAMAIGWVPDPATYPNYEAHIFLAPNPGIGSPDWNSSDMGSLQIQNRADGTAAGRMMWKTNDAMDNAMLYSTGTFGYLNAPTMLGTWSITFTNDTDFVVSGPGGVSTNWSLPADWLASYNAVNGGAAYAYFDGDPAGTANSGQQMFLSQVAVGGGGGAYAYTNNFLTLPLDTTTWGLLGNETVQVLPVPYWWVKWTLPAVNYSLFAGADVAPGNPWVRLTGNTNLPVPVSTYTWGTNMKTLVAAADLPGTNHNFFVLEQLVANKLQVLMPGETNAPFTATGKTGTPDPQALGANVIVTVNAVDTHWNIVTTCTDSVHLTSSTDSSFFSPPDAALVNGTQTFIINFYTAGNETVTATDVTKPSVTANTGSPTLVQ